LAAKIKMPNIRPGHRADMATTSGNGSGPHCP
jgi:hypothetical protein